MAIIIAINNMVIVNKYIGYMCYMVEWRTEFAITGIKFKSIARTADCDVTFKH